TPHLYFPPIIPPPPPSTLFPYTTLFRSRARRIRRNIERGRARHRRDKQASRTRDSARRLSPGSFLPAERDPLLRAGSARPQGRHPHAGEIFPARIQLRIWKENARAQRLRHGNSYSLSL